MASPGEGAPVGAPFEVVDDAGAHRLVARAGAEIAGQLTYARTADGALDLLHTTVRPSWRGRGVGEVLVRAALARARQEGVRVIPTCPFVAAYLDGHPEERDLLEPAPR